MTRIDWRGNWRETLMAACLAGAAALALTSTPRLQTLLLNTAQLAGGAMLLGLPLGAVWGLVAAKIDVPGRRAVRATLVALMLTPLAVYAAGWQAAVGGGGWLMRWGAQQPYATALAGWPGAIWVHGMASVPWVAALVWAALASVERPYEEQMLLDASSGRVLARVSLRAALGGVVAAALWIVAACGAEIAVVDFFLTAPGQNTFAEEIYVAASLGTLGTPPPATGLLGIGRLSGPLWGSDLARGTLILALCAAAGLLAIVARLPAALAVAPATRWVWQPQRARPLLALGLAATWALVVGVPLASLLWQAGATVAPTPDGPVRNWSLATAAARTALSPWEHRREWGWTLMIAAPAAATALLLAMHGAWLARPAPGSARRSAPLTAFGVAVLALAAAVPGPLVSVAIIATLNRPPDSPFAWLTVCYDRTLLAPILVQTIRGLPWTAAVVWALWQRVPNELLDAARCDGMGYWRQLWQLALPHQARGVAIAGGLAFAIAAGELSGTLLTLPPGVTPITVRLFGLLHYGMDERAAALCLSMCGGAVLWGVCGWAISGRAARGGGQASR